MFGLMFTLAATACKLTYDGIITRRVDANSAIWDLDRQLTKAENKVKAQEIRNELAALQHFLAEMCETNLGYVSSMLEMSEEERDKRGAAARKKFKSLTNSEKSELKNEYDEYESAVRERTRKLEDRLHWLSSESSGLSLPQEIKDQRRREGW